MKPERPAAPPPEEPLELPELDVDDGEEESRDAGALDLGLPELDGEGENEVARDLPVDLGLRFDQEPDESPDAAEAETIDAPPTLGLTLPERSESLLGSDDDRGCGDDESLGIEELPDGREQTDADGLDDPGAEQVDAGRLPALDGDEDDGEEIDLGIHIDEPAGSDDPSER
ncbi:MAG: hypothetical protein JRI23_16185 [Deltaproteobacteria bacterium]|nr:hypothetical protein [Deltaproteobacteria bacterium]MBW2533310.1 hypothetical protein [Deltaproteobacteria bacterium]